MIFLTHAMPEEWPDPGPSHPKLRPVLTGIGKVLAVSQLAKALLREPAEMVISVGFCGGLNGTRQGDVVMPNRCLQWDLQLGELHLPLGHGYARHCPLRLPEVQLACLPNPRRGLMISGDRFVDASVHVNREAVAVDMETAALALLCAELAIPLVCIREVSDVADAPQGMPHQEFMSYMRARGPAYREAVAELLHRGPIGIPPPQAEPPAD